MKRTILVFLGIVAVGILGAQLPQWLWAAGAGGLSADECYGVAHDASGNTYITGKFIYSASFGDIQLTSNGNGDIFVAKYDTEGQAVWAVNAGGADNDCGYSLTLDPQGYIYVTGCFCGNASFGNFTLQAIAENAVFVGCLDAQGNWLWAVKGDGYSVDSIEPKCLVLSDNADYLYACGEFSGHATFGGNALTSFGNKDIWVAKLDLTGNWLWATQAGGAGNDGAKTLAFTADGGLVTGGYITGTANFGSIALTGPAVANGFVAWLSPAGQWETALRLSSNANSVCNDLDLDSQDNIYLAGDFRYDLECGGHQFAGDWQDIFIARINGDSRSFEWVQTAFGPKDQHSAAVAVTSQDRIYWAGYFLISVQFGMFQLTFVSSADIFLVRLDPSGDYHMALHAGNICDDLAQDMAVDTSGNVYLAGYYTGDMYFGDFYLPFHDDEQIFAAKLHETVPLADDVNVAPATVVSNYPNPFSGQTVLRYSLKDAAAKTELSIYNLRGQKIRRFDSVSGTAGEHEIVWDGKDQSGRKIPPGIYLCRLTTPADTLTRRMIMLD